MCTQFLKWFLISWAYVTEPNTLLQFEISPILARPPITFLSTPLDPCHSSRHCQWNVIQVSSKPKSTVHLYVIDLWSVLDVESEANDVGVCSSESVRRHDKLGWKDGDRGFAQGGQSARIEHRWRYDLMKSHQISYATKFD